MRRQDPDAATQWVEAPTRRYPLHSSYGLSSGDPLSSSDPSPSRHRLRVPGPSASCGPGASSGALALAFFLALSFARPPAAQAAGLLIADGGLGGVLEVKEHLVQVTINNGVAVTQVRQVFLNTESRQVEALYTFPVPRGASVANFSMWINGSEMVGEVVEKERAREIYSSYKRVRRDPGLLEQVDFRTFEMRIFPIAPRAEQRVEVTYYQELDTDDDWATYVYPLATTTRRDLNQRTTGKFGLSVEVKAEIPIVELQSPSHPGDFAIAKHSEYYGQASLETRAGDLGKDVVLAYRTSRPRTGIDMVASKEKGEDGYFLLTLSAGEELAPSSGGMDYVFILDVSGSMRDDGKLDISKDSLGAFVKALGQEDRFEIIRFNVDAGALFRGLKVAGVETTAPALGFLASQQALGGTNLRPAVEAAYRYADPARQLNVVILSDGLTDQGDRSAIVAMIRARPTNTRVFCIGIGNDVNRGLLEQIAEESGGLAAFISRGDNFSRQAQAFRRKLLRPVAEEIKIDFAGVEVYDVEPRRLPNLYHGCPVRLYGRYKDAGSAKVSVKAKLREARTDQVVDISFPETDATNPQIERMWASRRVDRLLKEADAGGNRSTVVDEIVRLGERFSIVSEYTSFIVLENDAEYRRWKIERKNSLRVARDRQAQAELAARLEAIREKAHGELGPAAAPEVVTATPTSSQPRRGADAMPRSQSSPPPSTRSTAPSRPRSQDFSFGGGGAIDPISGGIALGLAALAVAAGRRRKGKREDNAEEPPRTQESR